MIEMMTQFHVNKCFHICINWGNKSSLNIKMKNLFVIQFCIFVTWDFFLYSYTFQQVQDNSEKVWRFYRYSLIYEFFDKPTFPPPLIVLNLLFRMMKYLRSYCGAPRKLNHDFCKYIAGQNSKHMSTRPNFCQIMCFYSNGDNKTES